jgi:hypothetical protein
MALLNSRIHRDSGCWSVHAVSCCLYLQLFYTWVFSCAPFDEDRRRLTNCHSGTMKLLAYLHETDNTLSRTTATGTVSSTASPNKKPMLLREERLLAQMGRNRRAVSEYIRYKKNYIPKRGIECALIVICIAELTGLKLFPEGIFREWDYAGSSYKVSDPGAQIAPDAIFQGLENLGGQVLNIADFSTIERRLQDIAMIEWRIGIGPLHPFYDGCGRVARYFSTLLSLWFDVPVVIHRSRDDYFSAARGGIRSFQNYYSACDRFRIDD